MDGWNKVIIPFDYMSRGYKSRAKQDLEKNVAFTVLKPLPIGLHYLSNISGLSVLSYKHMYSKICEWMYIHT